MNNEELKRIAYHEAGHAVAGYLLDVQFKAVSILHKKKNGYMIEAGQKVPTEFSFSEGIIWPEEKTERINSELMTGKLDIREAIVCMAGPTAEALFVGGELDEETRQGAMTDTNYISACCRAAMMPGKSFEAWKPAQMEEPIINAIGLQALDLVSRLWDHVQAIARALLRFRYLSFDKVSELITESVRRAVERQQKQQNNNAEMKKEN